MSGSNSTTAFPPSERAPTLRLLPPVSRKERVVREGTMLHLVVAERDLTDDWIVAVLWLVRRVDAQAVPARAQRVASAVLLRIRIRTFLRRVIDCVVAVLGSRPLLPRQSDGSLFPSVA